MIALALESENSKKRIRMLEQELEAAKRKLNEQSNVVKMLQAENKHLASLVDDGPSGREESWLRDMYDSAPQRWTAKRQQASRQPDGQQKSTSFNLTHDSSSFSKFKGAEVPPGSSVRARGQQRRRQREIVETESQAPISVHMSENPKLGWAVNKQGVILHRIMVEFKASLDKLGGRKMSLNWSVMQRYSSFESLVTDLRGSGFLELPPLPAKSWFGINPQKRQQNLSIFLQHLLKVPGVLGSKAVQRFLNLSAEMIRLLPGNSNRKGRAKRDRE
jgi:hypothetical protein